MINQGARVKVIAGYVREGETGEMYRYHSGLDMYFVRMDDGQELAFCEKDLALDEDNGCNG